MKTKILLIITALLIVVILTMYIPPARNWNQKQIDRLNFPNNFCFSVAGNFDGDANLFGKFLDASKDNFFVVANGNIIDSGIVEEYHSVIWLARSSSLPVIFVPGVNEDSYGSNMFETVFGKPYFSFNSSDVLFVVLDDGMKSLDVDQFNWLEKELSKPFNTKVVFVSNSIINPWDSVYDTDGGKLIDYLFSSKNVTLVISSGEKYSSFSKDGVGYVIVGKTNDKFNYLNVCVNDGSLTFQRVGYADENSVGFSLLGLIPALVIFCKAILLAIILKFSVDIIKKNWKR